MQFPAGGNLWRTQSYYGWTGSTGDSNRRLSAIKVGTSNGGSDRLNLGYNYDTFSNLKTLTEAGVATNFVYDLQNRLTTAYGKDYGYDSAGRITSYESVVQSYGTAHPHAVQAVLLNQGAPVTRQVVVRAAGSSGCGGGWPVIQLYVNGATNAAWVATVNSTVLANYTFNLPLSGRDQIAVLFTNDCTDASGDRNLTVDYVTVATASGTTTVQAEGAAVIDRGATATTALDGIDAIPGQEGIYWGASLRFVVAPDNNTILLKYDANGNLAYKVRNGQADIFTFDAENHLTQFKRNGVVLESYAYDADGNRVKVVRSGLVTYQPFLHYQVDNGTVEKYYSFAGQRVAMKRGTVLTYLHNNHLGSPVLTTNASIATQTYYAYGKVRTFTGSFPTRYQFTGQYLDNSSLVYMNARYYDPQVGVFISADTIVPNPSDSSSYNRYMYVRGNPLKFVDPSGHDPIDAKWEAEWRKNHCAASVSNCEITDRDRQLRLYSLAYKGHASNSYTWTAEDWQYTLYNQKDEYDNVSQRQSVTDFASALERLASHYAEDEKDQFVSAIALLYYSWPYDPSGINTWTFSRPQLIYPNHQMNGFDPRLHTGIENTHHFAGHLLIGYHQGTVQLVALLGVEYYGQSRNRQPVAETNADLYLGLVANQVAVWLQSPSGSIQEFATYAYQQLSTHYP